MRSVGAHRRAAAREQHAFRICAKGGDKKEEQGPTDDPGPVLKVRDERTETSAGDERGGRDLQKIASRCHPAAAEADGQSQRCRLKRSLGPAVRDARSEPARPDTEHVGSPHRLRVSPQAVWYAAEAFGDIVGLAKGGAKQSSASLDDSKPLSRAESIQLLKEVCLCFRSAPCAPV